MITIIARWEDTQMPPETEWQMWGQLRGAFGITRFKFVPVMEGMSNIDIDQYDTMEDALASLPEGTSRAFLEPTGWNPVTTLPQGDIAVIVGNTSHDNTAYADLNETYSIRTLGVARHNHLYGINAAAIALALRLGQ